MAEYIEKEKIIEKIRNTPFGLNCTGETEDYKEGVLRGLVAKQHNVIYMTNEQPSADVAPVVHGRWILYPRPHYFKCSKCKYTVPYKKAYAHSVGREYNYCPHCGAKMDGAENE